MGDGRCQSDHSDVSSIPPDEARRLDEQLGRLEENVLILSEMNVSQATEHLWDASQLTLISLCAGVCGIRYSVRAWGWTGGSGGVCALHQWIHLWKRARSSGGPGGLCSSPGAAVWAPGAFGLDAVLSLSLSLSFWISAAASHSSEDTVTLQLMSNITKVFVYFNYLNCFRYLK